MGVFVDTVGKAVDLPTGEGDSSLVLHTLPLVNLCLMVEAEEIGDERRDTSLLEFLPEVCASFVVLAVLFEFLKGNRSSQYWFMRV